MVKLEDAERRLAWYFFEFRGGVRAQSYEPHYGHETDLHARLIDERHRIDMDSAELIRRALCACAPETRSDIVTAYQPLLHSVLLQQYFFRKRSKVSIVALALDDAGTITSCAKAHRARLDKWTKAVPQRGNRPRQETSLEHLHWLAAQRDEKALRPIVKATMGTFDRAVAAFASHWEVSLNAA